MATLRPSHRPLACWKSALRQARLQKLQQRLVWGFPSSETPRAPDLPPELLPQHEEAQSSVPPESIPSEPKIIPSSQIAQWHIPGSRTTPPGVVKPKHPLKHIGAIPPPPSAKKTCPDPIKAVQDAQLTTLDPTGARRRLFDKANPDAAKVGDILLVRFRPGSGQPDQFAGVCINIRRRGIDSVILLRGQLTRVGVEMWVKIFSPNVGGIEVVQRKEKRARRARLYYMRQPKHDVGSVENLVRQYQRRNQVLGAGARGRDANSQRKKNNKRGRN